MKIPIKIGELLAGVVGYLLFSGFAAPTIWNFVVYPIIYKFGIFFIIFTCLAGVIGSAIGVYIVGIIGNKTGSLTRFF